MCTPRPVRPLRYAGSVATRRFTADGERLREQLVERLARLEPLAELVGLRLELGVSERPDRGLERVARHDRGHDALDVPLVLGAEDLPEDHVDHQNRLWHT